MTELAPGSVFEGRFEIEALLGEGGFGSVYGAIDHETRRRVAIKVVRAADDTTRRRFQREVAIVSALDSPHIVRILHHGIAADGAPFAVFEHLPGRDLSSVLQDRGTLAPEVVTHILEQLLAALRDAHARGLLHRDIKPENVRVFAQGDDPWHVKLFDFGIARSTDGGHPNLTATGELVGTPRYMSPEQLLDRELTARSDIYSLGVVAFEMLAGRDALPRGSWGEQLPRLQSGYAFDAPALASAGTLRRVVRRMTARAVRERYATAEAVLRDLREAVPDRPRRTWPTAAAIAAAFLLLLVVAVFVSRQDERGPSTTTRPSGNPFAVARGVLPSRDAGSAEEVHQPKKLPPQTGCGREAPFRGGGRLGDGWLAHLPAGYSPTSPIPLMIVLHGRSTLPDELLDNGGLRALAEDKGFAIVAPLDPTIPQAGRPWNEEREDMRFVDYVYEQTALELCVDRSKVFVLGHEMGGELAEALLCRPWVTAAAKNSQRTSSRPRAAPLSCISKPFMMLSPKRSNRLPVEGGSKCVRKSNKTSLAEDEAGWRERQGCHGDGERWGDPHPNGECTTWSCGSPLVSCHLDGGDPWPGTSGGACGGTAPDYPSAAQVWRFFEEADALRLGCGAEPPFAGRAVLDVGEDELLTYLPSGYDPDERHPLVVLLHQALEPPGTLLPVSGFEQLADEHGFIVVAPEDREVPAAPWKRESDKRRVARIAPLVAGKLCIDLDRVFVVGHGQGGHVAERLSCVPWIRGMAISAHRAGPPLKDACKRPAPVPLIMLTPTKSAHVPIEGGRSCGGRQKLPLDVVEGAWRGRNRCSGPPETVVSEGESRCEKWECDGAPFMSCRVDGGQSWPNAPKRPDALGCDGPPPTFPSAKHIWDFFARATSERDTNP